MRKLLGGFLLAVAAFSAQAQISGAVIPVICSDGTAASPCYTFTSAVNKGFWSPSTNTVGISIGGTNVGTWSSTGYSTPFASTAASYFATGGGAVGVATSGLQLWQATNTPIADFIDSTRTANNKIHRIAWFGGTAFFQFINDSASASTSWLTVNGGQASGITGITSNSGSGAWTHTNTRSSGVTNNGLVLADTVTGAQTPGFGTAIQWSSNAGSSLARIVFEAGGDGLNNQSQIGLYTQVSSGTLSKQVQINPVASATNYIALSGSAAGAPAISVEGASASISTTYGAKGAGSHLFYADYPSTPTLQFEVRRTASATNWIYVTGSNGSAPTLGTSGSSLNLSPIGLVALNVGSQASAVNFFTMTATNSGSFPLFGVSGTDSNIGLDFTAKGTFGYRFFSDSATNIQFAINRTAGATNYLIAAGSNAAAPVLSSSGSGVSIRPANGAIDLTTPLATDAIIKLIASGVQEWDIAVPTATGALTFTAVSLTERGRFTPQGYFKASSNGSYLGSANSYHEFYQTSDASVQIAYLTHAGATATNQFGLAVRLTGDPNNTANYFLVGEGNVTTRFKILANGNYQFGGFLFANIGTALNSNGIIGYCSDCTIANPCAGGGTGALAKRLNGVNVCN